MTSNYTNYVKYRDRNICRSCLYVPTTNGCQLCNVDNNYSMFEPRQEPRFYAVKLMPYASEYTA